MLSNKIIIVTGGCGLIGQNFIKAIAKNGATAIIADICEKALITTQEKLQQETDSQNIDTIIMDITDKLSIVKAIETIHDKYGKIDGLVNSAYPRNKGFGTYFFDKSIEDFNDNINTHLGGYFLTSQQFALYFKKQGYGNIINLASLYGVVAPTFELYKDTPMTVPIEYAAIKSAIVHLTKYMAKYFKGLNIRVNAITPGGIFDHQNEEFLPRYKEKCLNKGMLDAKDLCGTLIYLLSDMSKFVNGQNIIVDDGFTL